RHGAAILCDKGVPDYARATIGGNPLGGRVRLAVRVGHGDDLAKANDVVEADLLQHEVELLVAKSTVCQEGHAHSSGQHFVEPPDHLVLVLVAIVLEAGLHDGLPNEGCRPTMRRHEVD